MGSIEAVLVPDIPDHVSLPTDDSKYWKIVTNIAKRIPTDSSTLLSFFTNLSGSSNQVSSYGGLLIAIEKYGEEDFYKKLLPRMIQLLRSTEKIFGGRRIMYLKQNNLMVESFSKQEVSVILVNGFFNTLRYSKDKKFNRGLNCLNFYPLLSPKHPSNVAKILMFLNYFERVTKKLPEGDISITRQYMEVDKDNLFANKENIQFKNTEVFPEGGIETSRHKARQADFANMFIGGGVIGQGCVQEEIKFSVNPELCVAMLICPCLTEKEAIIIKNTQIYSNYSGYGRSLKYEGNFVDTLSDSEIVAMDALDFRGRDVLQQWERNMIDREIIKAYISFFGASKKRVSTGNWGCGAFRGDHRLKFLIQWIASSLADVEMDYYTFERNEPILCEEFKSFVEFVFEKKLTVQTVYLHLIKIFQVSEKKNIDLKSVSTLEIVKKMINNEELVFKEE